MNGTELLGRFTLTWPDGVFPLGGDSLALGRFATVKDRRRVCDLGCGSGALMLLLADRAQELKLYAIDIDPLAAETAQANLTANALEGTVLCGDLRHCPFPAGTFDLVIANPPYFPVGSGTSGGSARCEEACTLNDMCSAASRLLKNGGRFALCHRPERLCDVMCALRAVGIEPKRLKLLCHSPSHPPSAVLVEGVRQGKPGVEIIM